MTRSCSHWALSSTGTCETCNVLVAVTEGTTVTISLGSVKQDAAKLTGEFEFAGSAPTIRTALANALKLAPSMIQIVDVVPISTWERSTGVVFALGKVELQAVVSMRDTLIRTPERVEYEEVATVA